MTLDQEKERLRMIAKQTRAQIKETDRAQASVVICHQIRRASFFEDVRVVMVYATINGEVDMSPLSQMLLDQTPVAIAYPKVSKATRQITPIRIHSLSELAPGAYDIPEPKDALLQVAPSDIDMVIVPGLAFDRQGNRLGYGGGFYDRFLPRLSPQAVKVGVQYDLLLWDAIPAGTHDATVDWIVTEKQVLKVQGQS